MLPDVDSNRALRILIVSNLFPPYVMGGAEVVAQRQARDLVSRGHTVTVFAGRIAEDIAARGRIEREDSDGLAIWRASVASFDPDDNFRNPRIAELFKAVLNAVRPDVVHFHNMAGLGVHLVPLASRRGIPSVVTLHDLWGFCYRATMLRPDGSTCVNTDECGTHCLNVIRPHDSHHVLPMRLRRDYVIWCLGHASALISPSVALADAFVRAGAVKRERITVVSNGIDLKPFRDLVRVPSATVRFLCVAYLGEHKGIPDLVDAAHMLSQQKALNGRWTLTIAGDGHLREEIEGRISALGLGNSVQCVGRVPRAKIIEMLGHTDVVVLPSRWPENEPVSLLEAIAAGVAQLATDVGGVGALIQQGETGTLVPPSSPARLAEAMKAYVDAPERSHAEGARNLARREAFAQEAATEAVLSVYAHVLSQQAFVAPAEPMIICAGSEPSPDVIDTCQRLHETEGVEASGRRVRLVWHDWLPAEAWGEAAAFWHWGAHTDFAAAQKALRWDLPVIAPAACEPLSLVGRTYGGVTAAEPGDETRRVLARLACEPSLLHRSWDSRGGANMLSAVAPQASFHLSCPDNWP